MKKYVFAAVLAISTISAFAQQVKGCMVPIKNGTGYNCTAAVNGGCPGANSIAINISCSELGGGPIYQPEHILRYKIDIKPLSTHGN